MTNVGGQTPLMFAVSIGDTECVLHLLEKGANISARDKVGRTALHYCCRGGNVQNLNVLLDWIKNKELDLGTLIEESSNGGLTPLMSAI